MKKLIISSFLGFLLFLLFQIFFNSRWDTFIFPEKIESMDKINEKKEGEATKNEIRNVLNTEQNIKKDVSKDIEIEIKENFIEYIKSVSAKTTTLMVPHNWQDRNLYREDREKLEKILSKTDSIVEKNKSYENLDEYFVYYNSIRNIIDKYKELEDALDVAIKEGFITKPYSIPSETSIQKFKENTCVVDTLHTIMRYQYKKILDKGELYRLMGKKLGEYWYSEYYNYNGIEQWKGDGDYKKLAQMGIYSQYVRDLVEVEKRLKNGEIALLEAHISEFSNDRKWKGSNVYHAVAVFALDNGILTYADTLDGQVKKKPISHFTEQGKHYAFRFFSFNNTKIPSLKNILK